MKTSKPKIVFCILTLIVPILCFGQQISDSKSKQQIVDNLHAFAKLYGYVKYFHPSDEACKIDWDKFAVYGVEKVKSAKNSDELKSVLEELFLPIAPTMKIAGVSESLDDIPNYIPEDTTGLKIIAWQHFGVGLSEKSNIYRSWRVYNNAKVVESDRERMNLHPNLQKIPQRIKLFNEFPDPGESISGILCHNIKYQIPLTCYADLYSTLPRIKNNKLKDLLDTLNSMEPFKKDSTSEDIKIADTIIYWNVMQHFYPYFDVINVNWGNVLTNSISEILTNNENLDYYWILRKMVADLHDGHGYVMNLNYYEKPGGIPIRVEEIENKMVITASEDSIFHKGDIILKINNMGVLDYMKERSKYFSGSVQLVQYRSLNQFGGGVLRSDVNLKLIRDGREINVLYERKDEKRDYFFNPISEFDFPYIKNIGDSIYYVNTMSTDDRMFNDSLNNLLQAKGVIFDTRWDGKWRQGQKSLSLNTVLLHLIDKPVKSAFWLVPKVIYPDRNKLQFYENRWTRKPAGQKFKGKVVFINDPHVVSKAETYMGIVEYYKLADMVGTTTAGCNGNANYIDLPGGFQVMWTGMKVLKHDGSQHHLIGIKPTYPVEKTIEAVKEGRDEYLEKAIEVIKNSN